MRCVLVLCVTLLAACGEQPADHLADALKAKILVLHGANDPLVKPEEIAAFQEALRQAGPDEYQTLADLPPIPPSFDEPADGEAPPLTAVPEDTP